MVAPISALMNMEMALYGGVGSNSAAPSLANNYMGALNNSNQMGLYPYGYGYPYYNNGYYNQTPANYSASSQIAQPQTSAQTTEASKSDLDTLTEYFKKNNAVEEGLGGAAFGGLTFAAMENPQTLAHPINAFKATAQTDKIFKGILESNSAAKALWTSEPAIMQDAYSQLFRVNRNAQSKWRQLFVKQMAEPERAALEKIMTDALKTGDKEAIQIATEQLRAASKNNGRIPQAMNWVKNQFRNTPQAMKTPTELANEALVSGAAKKAVSEQGLTFAKKCLKDGKGWFLFDMIFSAGKIWTAFTHKDGGTGAGITQTAQSTVKAAGNAFGWVAGKAVGGWAGAKLGAKIGSRFPGWGTAAGAILGFIGGSLGMFGMGKVTKAVVGEDVATKIENNSMKKTPEGQSQLLSFVAQKYQMGEKVPDNVMLAAQNVANSLESQMA